MLHYKPGGTSCEVLVLIERNKRLTPKSLRHSETYDAIQVSFSNFYLALFWSDFEYCQQGQQDNYSRNFIWEWLYWKRQWIAKQYEYPTSRWKSTKNINFGDLAQNR